MGKRKRGDSVRKTRQKKRLQSDEKKVNPFEVRVNRKKHDVLGQRSKSDRGLPGVSRSKAIQKRKKTLLQEYKQRHKTNLFVDRRFGEFDETLAPEEKMMQRFILEKQKRHERSGRYGLEDDDLTHYGQSIGDMENFDEIKLSEQEEEEEDIAETHFGGFLRKKRPRTDERASEQDEERPRTRKQIMDEVVTKSKAMKYERQVEKEEVDNLMERLDSEWRDIEAVVTRPVSQLLPAGVKDAPRVVDDYDRAVRELLFERRGQPADRMKSEFELAREERERLEKHEVERILRMKDLPAASREDTEHFSADLITERPPSMKDCRAMLLYKDGELVLPDGAEMDGEATRNSVTDADSMADGSSEEDDTLRMEEDGGDTRRTEENYLHEEVSFGALVERCLRLGETPTAEGFTRLDKLVRSLFKQAQLNPALTATVFQQKLQTAYEKWTSSKKGHFEYPPFSNLLLFKLIGLLFPTSDFRHPLVTPTMIFMGQLLTKCRPRDVGDLIRGLFVCQLLIAYISLSKRFIPEVINFVTSVLGSYSEHCILYPPFVQNSGLGHKLSCSSCRNLSCASCELGILDMVIMTHGEGGGGAMADGDEVKCSILKVVLNLGLQVVELYETLSSFAEVFSPLTTNIQSILETDEDWPPLIKDLFTKLSESIVTKSSTPKMVLQLLKQKPKSIRFYEPKFDEVYEVGRRKVGSKAVGERQKLRYKVKKERKGAIREIRKDNSFLAKERLRETGERDAERARKTKQILHDLQMMQHEAKMEKLKKRK